MTDTHAKNQGQRSDGLEVRVETTRWTDGRTRPNVLHSLLTRSVKAYTELVFHFTAGDTGYVLFRRTGLMRLVRQTRRDFCACVYKQHSRDLI